MPHCSPSNWTRGCGHGAGNCMHSGAGRTRGREQGHAPRARVVVQFGSVAPCPCPLALRAYAPSRSQQASAVVCPCRARARARACMLLLRFCKAEQEQSTVGPWPGQVRRMPGPTHTEHNCQGLETKATPTRAPMIDATAAGAAGQWDLSLARGRQPRGACSFYFEIRRAPSGDR